MPPEPTEPARTTGPASPTAEDAVRQDDTRGWLEKARKDLMRARRNLSFDPPDAEDCLFHCQQAAEKAMKAVLTWHDEPFRKTHDLEELAHACAGLEASLAPATRGLAPLTRFAWEYRYPGESAPPTKAAALEWVERVATVVTAVEAVLPERFALSYPA